MYTKLNELSYLINKLTIHYQMHQIEHTNKTLNKKYISHK